VRGMAWRGLARLGKARRGEAMSQGWNQEGFDAALNRFLPLTKRTIPEVINRKAYFIARKALWFTAKVERSRIKGELGRMVFTRTTSASGRTTRHRSLELTPSSSSPDISLAKMILIARYRKRGSGWPSGASGWDAAIRSLIASRERSTAYLKSGWLPAIRFLANFVPNKSGGPANDSDTRQYGDAKGSAEAATEGNLSIAKIINSAITRHETSQGQALDKYGSRALDLAFFDETQDILQEIAKRLNELANGVGMH